MTPGSHTISRRGFSLIEMLAVIACLAGVLALAAVTLQGLGRIGRADRLDRAAQRIADRLADRFRTDVHQAERSGPERDGTLRLEGPGEARVEYRVEGSRVVVTRREGGQPQGVESVLLGGDGSARLAWFERNGRRFARLQCPGRSPCRPLIVEAALGLDAATEVVQ